MIANDAFIAGLLHDVGKLFLLTVIESISASAKKGFHLSDTLINEVLHSLHTEHGHTILKNWNLPQKYCDVALCHHLEKIDEKNSLLVIIRLVDKACNMMGIGLEKDSSIMLAASEEVGLLCLSEITMAELEIKLEDSMAVAG